MNYRATKRHGENLNSLLSEGNQSEKSTYFKSPAIWRFGKGKTGETVKRSVFAKFRGKEGGMNR